MSVRTGIAGWNPTVIARSRSETVTTKHGNPVIWIDNESGFNARMPASVDTQNVDVHLHGESAFKVPRNTWKPQISQEFICKLSMVVELVLRRNTHEYCRQWVNFMKIRQNKRWQNTTLMPRFLCHPRQVPCWLAQEFMFIHTVTGLDWGESMAIWLQLACVQQAHHNLRSLSSVALDTAQDEERNQQCAVYACIKSPATRICESALIAIFYLWCR